MISLACVCSIIHLAICLPARWLVGNCHKPGKHNWYMRSIGIMVDILDQSSMVLDNTGKCTLDELLMIGIFQELYVKLPHFARYLNRMYNNR